MRFSHPSLRVFCVLLGVLCAALSAKADPIVITFDDVPSGTYATYNPAGIGFHTVHTNTNGEVMSTSSAIIQSSSQANTPSNAIFGGQLNPLALLHNNVAGQFLIAIPAPPHPVNRATTDFVSLHVVGTVPGQTNPWTVAFYDLTYNPYDLTVGLIGTVSGLTDQFVSFSYEKGIHAFVLMNSGPNLQEGIDTVSFNAPQVPEPATLVLLGTGITAMASKLHRRRKGRKQANLDS
jgi:hypothetical protein